MVFDWKKGQISGNPELNAGQQALLLSMSSVFGSYFAGFHFSGTVGRLGVRIDCLNRSVHCRLSLVFSGPSCRPFDPKSPLDAFSFCWTSELSSARVVLPSVGDVHCVLRSCFSRSVDGQLGEDDMFKACHEGANDTLD